MDKRDIEMINAVQIAATTKAAERYTKFLKMYLPGENNLYRVEEDQNQNFEKIDGALENAQRMLTDMFSKKQNKEDLTLETTDKTVTGAINELNIRRVDTIEQLKASDVKVGDIVEVLGYYSKDDGATHKRVISDSDDGSGVELANGLWANILHNGEVNVSWFGARGDGVTDDYDIVVKAMQNFSGKIIRFSAKKYLFKHSLELDDSTNLQGVSSNYFSGGQTHLIFDISEGACITTINGELKRGITLKHFTLQCLKADRSIDGIATLVAYFDFEDISISNCKVGITTTPTTGVSFYGSIKRCKISDCENGLYVHANAVTVCENFVQNCDEINIQLSGRNVTAFNNDFASYDGVDTKIGLSLSFLYGSSVYANYFEGYAQTMIYLGNVHGCSISNFEISVISKENKPMKMINAKYVWGTTFDGLIFEGETDIGQLNLTLGTCDWLFGSSFKNINLPTTQKISGFTVGHMTDSDFSHLNFSPKDSSLNIIDGGSGKIELDKNLIELLDFRVSELTETIKVVAIGRSPFGKIANADKIEGYQYSEYDKFPNRRFNFNFGARRSGFEQIQFKNRLQKLDTPYWKGILEQENLWGTLVTYLNNCRKYFNPAQPQALVDFCEKNNIL